MARVEVSDGKGKVVEVIDDGIEPKPDTSEKLKEAKESIDKIKDAETKKALQALADALDATLA